MKKVLKGVGIAFIALIIIGAIANMGEETEKDLGSGKIEPTQQTSTPAVTDTEPEKQQEVKQEEPKKPNFEVLEHEYQQEDFMAYITGIIINNTNKEYSYVQVEINLYDEDGTLIGSTLDNVNNLGPGKKWKFKAIVIEDDVASYEIKGVTGF